MQIKSVFESGEKIPKKYTCDGDDFSPEIHILDVPKEAKSLTLIVDDPDCPIGTFTHWVLYNLPADTVKIEEKIPAVEILQNGTMLGAMHGVTDFKSVGYGGPCPPSGMHRYFFKLYALDKVLDLPVRATKKQVEHAIHGHIVEEAELIGLYSRK